MSDEVKLMNKERAERIVASREGENFEEALEYLRVHAPDSPVLHEYNEEVSAALEKANEIIAVMKNDRNEREVLGTEKKDLDKDREVEANIANITELLKDTKLNEHLVLIRNNSTYNIDVNVGYVLGESDKDKDLRKKYFDEIMEAAKQEVLMFYARDKNFSKYTDKQKLERLEENISDVFNFKISRIVAASSIEFSPNSAPSEDYKEEACESVQRALHDLYTGKKVTVTKTQILRSSVRTSESMDSYESDLSNNDLNNSAAAFHENKENYNEGRRAFWGDAFDKIKGMWRGIKNNKERILTDAVVVAGAGFSAPLAPIAPFIAAGVMGAYFLAGAFLWQINDERRVQKAKAKEKDAWRWKNAAAWKNAWHSISSDKAKYSKFWRQGFITGGAGVVGAGLFGWAASSVGVFAGKFIGSVSRAVGSVTSQGTNWYVTSKEYAKNANEENRVARDSARNGFFASAGTSLVSNLITAYFGFGHYADGVEPNVPNENPGIISTGKTASLAKAAADSANVDSTARLSPEVIKKWDAVFGRDSTDVQAADSTAVDSTAQEATSHPTANSQGAENSGTAENVQEGSNPSTTAKIPTEWDSSMGINKYHWNNLMKALGTREHFEEVYNNVVNAQKDNPELFKDIDPVKVMDEYFLKDDVNDWRNPGVFESKEELIASPRANSQAEVVDVTDFSKINPSNNYIYHHQITTIGADGKPVVHDFYASGRVGLALLKRHEIMFKLERIIECGEKVDISTKEANDFILAERVSTNGPRVSLSKIGDDCGDKNIYERSRVSFAQKHDHSVPPVKEAVKAKVKIDETTINNTKMAAPEHIDETPVDNQQKGNSYDGTYTVKRYTGGDDTVGSPTGSKPEKIISQGKISIPANSGMEI